MKKTKYDLYLAGVISESQYEATTENNVPNLDATTADQLKSFVAMYRNPRPQEAVQLTGISEPEMAMEAAKLLAVYATNKYHAMESRLKGDIGNALRHEEECDKIYDRLPDNLKW
jgi:hypothetical protein